MATHSSILAWRIPRTEEPGGLQSIGSHRVRHDWSDLASKQVNHSGFPGGSVTKNPPANAGDVGSIHDPGRSLGEGNGTPLQYSCLGNPMDKFSFPPPQIEWTGIRTIQKQLFISLSLFPLKHLPQTSAVQFQFFRKQVLFLCCWS